MQNYFKNMTEHEIRVHDEAGNLVVTLEPCGIVLRCEQENELALVKAEGTVCRLSPPCLRIPQTLTRKHLLQRIPTRSAALSSTGKPRLMPRLIAGLNAASA